MASPPEGSEKPWKVVELSNDYLQILILPEIGGKVWAAIEKTTGKSFIYFNHVVKFRDVGIAGHGPAAGWRRTMESWAIPPTVSAGRLPGASQSGPERKLHHRDARPADANKLAAGDQPPGRSGRFHNPFALAQRLRDGPALLHLDECRHQGGRQTSICQSRNHYIDHDGKSSDWPTSREQNRDLAWYEQNNFGSYKSYHVMGRFSEFFGGYRHDDDFGMARCSTYGVPGRKIWIWGCPVKG